MSMMPWTAENFYGIDILGKKLGRVCLEAFDNKMMNLKQSSIFWRRIWKIYIKVFKSSSLSEKISSYKLRNTRLSLFNPLSQLNLRSLILMILNRILLVLDHKQLLNQHQYCEPLTLLR